MADIFAHTITIINLIIVVQVFEIIYIDIIKYLLATGFKNNNLLILVLTYFEPVKINDQDIFHLYYLVWLCKAFHLLKIYNQLYFNLIYVIKIIRFIENFIKYFIFSKLKPKTFF